MKIRFILLFTILVQVCQAQLVLHAGDTFRVNNHIKVRAITERLYLYTVSYYDVPSNGMIYLDDSRMNAIIIDAPLGEGVSESLINFTQDKLGAKVKSVVVTHWHEPDRTGGLKAFHANGIPSYSSKKTIEIANEKKLFSVPENGFSDSLVIHFGKGVICKYFGAGHTPDNIIVWFAEEKVLYGGCMVKDMKSENLGYTADANINEWPLTIKKIIAAYPGVKIVVPGHFEYGNKDLLYHTLDLLK